MDLHVFHIPIPPPTSLSAQSLWVFPVPQSRALVSCIQPGLVICFTLDNIHVLMLFSRNIPPLPSPTESKILFCTSVSLFLFCIQGYRYHLSKFHFTFHLHALEKEMATPLQCSCLENPRDGGAWWAAIYGVTQSWIRLKWLNSSSNSILSTSWWDRCYFSYFIHRKNGTMRI